MFQKTRQADTTNPQGRAEAKDQNPRHKVKAEPLRRLEQSFCLPREAAVGQGRRGPAHPGPKGRGRRWGWRLLGGTAL